MDSPDPKLKISPSDSQGSPFFDFLCSLSPIKPVKSGHTVQTYTELSFPPPPAVFVSPRVETQKETARSKRKILIGTFDPTQAAKEKIEQKACLNPGENASLHVPVEEENRKPIWKTVSGSHDVSRSSTIMGSRFTSQRGSVLSPKIQNVQPSFSEYQLKKMQPNFELPSKNLSAFIDEHSVKHVQRSQIDPMVNVEDLTNTCNIKEEESIKKDGEVNSVLDNKEQEMVYPLKEADVKGSSSQPNEEKSQALDNSQANTDFFHSLLVEMGKGFSLGHKSDQQHLLTAWSEIPMEQLTGFVAEMQSITQEGVQNASINAESLESSSNCSLGAEDANCQELHIESGQRGCRVSGVSGFRRRCLDFETNGDSHKNPGEATVTMTTGLTSDKPPFCSYNLDSQSNRPPVIGTGSTQSDCPNSRFQMNMDYAHTSSDINMVQPNMFNQLPSSNNNAMLAPRQGSTSISPLDYLTKCPFPVGEPGGIGLHLNCLGFSMPMLDGDMNRHGSSLTSEANHMATVVTLNKRGDSPENDGNCISNDIIEQSGYAGNLKPGLVVSLVEETTMNQHEVQLLQSAQVGVTTSATCLRSVTLGIRPLEQDHRNEMENRVSPTGSKRVAFYDVSHQSESEQAEDSGHSPRSPKKKRKTSLSTGDNMAGESCKHCKCKKSRCLKLYCECFAAGLYCIDSCSCHDCFNKPEFKETVLGTRQQIESRNPLAFAPKIIRGTDSSPNNGEECVDTPSARHKRGCNCKKSQCLKKYCECYQAGVGCADGCRCEGCKNIYGRNEGSGDLEEKDQIATENIMPNEEIILSDSENKDDHHIEQHNIGLSPITPFFDQSGQSRPSLELSTLEDLSSPFALQSLMPFRSPSRLFESLEGNENIGIAKTQSHSSTAARKSNDPGQLSSGWDRLGEICTLTSLPQPLRFAQSLDAMLDRKGISPSFWQGTEHPSSLFNAESMYYAVREIPMSPMFQHSNQILNPSIQQVHMADNALTTPATPVLPSLNLSRIRHGIEDQADAQSHYGVWLSDDDDSPNGLKELSDPVAPNIALRTRSPQQKRVSPYQQKAKAANLRAMLSPGSRSRRKFILQALPSNIVTDLDQNG